MPGAQNGQRREGRLASRDLSHPCRSPPGGKERQPPKTTRQAPLPRRPQPGLRRPRTKASSGARSSGQTIPPGRCAPWWTGKPAQRSVPPPTPHCCRAGPESRAARRRSPTTKAPLKERGNHQQPHRRSLPAINYARLGDEAHLRGKCREAEGSTAETEVAHREERYAENDQQESGTEQERPGQIHTCQQASSHRAEQHGRPAHHRATCKDAVQLAVETGSRRASTSQASIATE